MGKTSLPDQYNAVNFSAADVRWTLKPVPPLERIDLLELNDRELFDYARELQREAFWLRTLLHEALSLLHRLTCQVDRCHLRIAGLLSQLRTLRRTRHGEASV